MEFLSVGPIGKSAGRNEVTGWSRDRFFSFVETSLTAFFHLFCSFFSTDQNIKLSFHSDLNGPTR